MPVTESLFNQKLKELEQTFRTSFSRKQRSLWYPSIKNWPEKRFLEACELVLTKREHLWVHENLLAILYKVTEGWRPTYRGEQENAKNLDT